MDGQQDIERKLQIIKSHMPETYAIIKRWAGENGSGVYGFVRRGLRGEANCFYACEAGHVVGTPFCDELMQKFVSFMAQYGGTSFVMMPELQRPAEEKKHGSA